MSTQRPPHIEHSFGRDCPRCIADAAEDVLHESATELLWAIEALVAGIEDAAPFHCGACVNSHTGNTGNTNCQHADEVNARVGRARATAARARGDR